MYEFDCKNRERQVGGMDLQSLKGKGWKVKKK